MRSFSWGGGGGGRFSDRMGGMVWMGATLTIGSSKSTVGGVNFGTLGRGVLLGFFLLRP